MSLNHTFHWPAGPNDVKVTGPFDNWSGSLPLVKQPSGDFSITVPFSGKEDAIIFKFIVDGDWKTSEEYEFLEQDGNVNNVVYAKDLVSSEANGSKIPESGGLVAAAVLPSSSEAAPVPQVLPSTEGQQTTLGEPGIVVPENAQNIQAFKEVSDVNAKDLNAKLNAKENAESEPTPQVLPSTEGAQTTLGEAGIAIPENAGDIKEFTEYSTVDAKDLNTKLNGKEAELADGKKRIKVKKVIKRNKVTGEEIVVSTEPVTEEAKTLDPNKVADDKDKENVSPEAATATATTASPAKTSASPAKTSSSPAKTSSSKKSGEKKGGFLRKLKKAFQ